MTMISLQSTTRAGERSHLSSSSISFSAVTRNSLLYHTITSQTSKRYSDICDEDSVSIERTLSPIKSRSVIRGAVSKWATVQAAGQGSGIGALPSSLVLSALTAAVSAASSCCDDRLDGNRNKHNAFIFSTQPQSRRKRTSKTFPKKKPAIGRYDGAPQREEKMHCAGQGQSGINTNGARDAPEHMKDDDGNCSGKRSRRGREEGEGRIPADSTNTIQIGSSVRFYTTVIVKIIPPRSDYPPDVREAVWYSFEEMKDIRARSKKEYKADGSDWRRATEEKDMILCPLTRELIHPVHYKTARWKGSGSSSIHNHNHNQNTTVSLPAIEHTNNDASKTFSSAIQVSSKPRRSPLLSRRKVANFVPASREVGKNQSGHTDNIKSNHSSSGSSSDKKDCYLVDNEGSSWLSTRCSSLSRKYNLHDNKSKNATVAFIAPPNGSKLV